MLERVIAGIIIGLVAGLLLGKKYPDGSKAQTIALSFVALVVVAFVGSSFVFGAIFGAMAVGEIALGYWISSLVTEQKQPSNDVQR
jgi:hypothetical protein